MSFFDLQFYNRQKSILNNVDIKKNMHDKINASNPDQIDDLINFGSIESISNSKAWQ